MEHALRPHRGGTVEAGARRPNRRLIIALVILATMVIAVTLRNLFISVMPIRGPYATSYELEPGIRRSVTTYYEGGTPEVAYQERKQADGTWMKDGPFVRLDLAIKKLEEGSYRDGKRDGQWSFRNEDGSLDESRSGIYENDVRVQAGPTAPGDYPTEGLRLKRLEPDRPK